MIEAHSPDNGLGHERRKYPRYPVTDRVNLAVEDESIGESIGIGEAVDISLGGLRIKHLPKVSDVREGDKLGLLLIDEERAVSLRAEVVHHATPDSFGVEFRNLSLPMRREIDELVQRLHV